jgi:hypothetical protein
MILLKSYDLAHCVGPELEKIKHTLRSIEVEKNSGVLRGLDGQRDPNILNLGLSEPRIEQFYTSEVLARLTRWFIFMSKVRFEETQPGREFMTMGYVGLTEPNGFVNYLHTDPDIQERLVLVAGEQTGFNIATMHYTGDRYTKDIETQKLSAAEAIDRLGEDNFVQPNMAQMASFGPNDPHIEPLMPGGLARVYLAATVRA